ncbi:BELONGS TO THE RIBONUCLEASE HII FAMILY [Encephalitozoon cuniculi GB-M1]|uniref:Ribonuclease n=2 Tax=Encephalitozoon cuniculi TaxID=6035 RepID=Q8SSA4_ENCCU|nr:ribonuclease H2 catalytic subunit RNH201 [Encephalitozoon cuniculi GB-M1]AGE95958.1 ribonuclease HII family protein [Encephalitozoon cuniculi]KMV66431.1 ribonuclease HII [Encephalitozoon cuniculi EcunIII-L]UYI28058.1 ribonuclease HII [Encephalitozoon cuniculi]CAD26213.1 BELONGS TO THE RIBONUCLEASE HII FAMILY [Encephalitozoon cuniculi GB-M1]
MESKNIFFSSFGQIEEEVVVGIDEAGRGPVVGYMVYGALVVPRGVLEDVGFKDSKVLTPAQRYNFFQMIKKKGFGYAYHCSHPDYITEMMQVRSVSLNEVSIGSVLRILDEVQSKCRRVDTIYVDALGDCRKYKERLEKDYPYRFVVEERADSKFQVVSGASIVAKVQRDMLISEFGEDLGSGYPSDPETIRWLRKNINVVFGFPPGVRYSWATVKKMLGERKSRPLKGALSGFYLDST